MENANHSFSVYMTALIRLMRPKHVIKNLLVFLPAFFSKRFLHGDVFWMSLLAFFSFSLAAVSVYVFNDICDVEKDRQQPQKKDRPIASGLIPSPLAVCLYGAFVIGALFIDVVLSCRCNGHYLS